MSLIRIAIAALLLAALPRSARAQLAVGDVTGTYQAGGTPHRFHGYVALIDLASRRVTPLVGRPASCGSARIAMATARDVDAAFSVLSGQWQGCEHPAPDCAPR